MAMGERAEICGVDGTSSRVQISLRTQDTDFSPYVPLTAENVLLPGPKDTSDLALLMESRQEHGGRAVAIFAPFWIVNRSGQPLVFRQSKELPTPGQQHPEQLLDKALMFSHPKFEFGGRTTEAALPDTKRWSKSFPINNVGAVGGLVGMLGGLGGFFLPPLFAYTTAWSGFPSSTFFVLFLLTGLMAGVASILLTSRIGSTRPTIATGWELEIVTMVVLGGVNILGGSGTIPGVFIAAFVMGLVTFGFGLLNVPGIVMSIFVGSLLISVIALPIIWSRIARRWRLT